MYVAHQLGNKVKFAPEEAKKEILEALRLAGANAEIAASKIGVTRRTFGRWIQALKLEQAAAKMRLVAKKKGWWKATPAAEA